MPDLSQEFSDFILNEIGDDTPTSTGVSNKSFTDVVTAPFSTPSPKTDVNIQGTATQEAVDLMSGLSGFEERVIKPTFETVGEFVGTKQVVEELAKIPTEEDVDPLRLAGGAGSAALLFFPAAVAAKAGQVLTKIPGLGRLLSQASVQLPKTTRATEVLGLGAGIGATEAAKEGEDVSEAAKRGAIISGGLQGGIKILGATFGAIPRSLTDKLLRLSKNEIKQAAKRGEKTVSDKFLNERRFGSYEDLHKDAQKSVKQIGEELSSFLSGEKKNISTRISIGNVSQSEAAKNALLSSDDIVELVTRKVPESKRFLSKKQLSVEDANKLRSIIDETIGDRGWIAQNTDKLDQKILKSFANDLRKTVKSTVPESSKLFSELSDEIKIRDALLDRIGQEGRGTTTLSKMFGIGTGGVVGAAGAIPGGVIGGLAVGALIETQRGQQALSIGINELSKAGVNATPAIRNALIRMMESLSD